jgi:hypothetical protein
VNKKKAKTKVKMKGKSTPKGAPSSKSAQQDPRPKSVSLKAAPKSAYSRPKPRVSGGGPSLMDKFRNFVTGGTQGTLNKAAKFKKGDVSNYKGI